MQALATGTDLQTDWGAQSDGGLIGVILGGRYRVLSRLAAGGMGQVYAAEHRLLGCRLALKTLGAGLRGNRAAEERFRREAAVGAAFSHPNLVRVLDFETAGVVPYLVMELLEGQDLRALLNTAQALPVERAVRLVRGALAGLSVAHAQGIVHRDLKPANLFVIGAGQEEQCKVLDFGVASIKGKPSVTLDPLTLSGRPLGTLAYMAPEQIRGAAGVDARADVYSVAAILFELVSGSRLFDATDAPEQIFRTLNDPVPRLDAIATNVPPQLADVVERALSRRPEDRFAHAAAFAQALEPYASAESEKRPPVPRSQRIRGQKLLLMGLGGCALGIIASSVVASSVVTPNLRASAESSRHGAGRAVSSCAAPAIETAETLPGESEKLAGKASAPTGSGSSPARFAHRQLAPARARAGVSADVPALPTITVDRGNPYQ
jgi:serine/threonine protein kinase